MPSKNKITLIGMPAAGKTTVGGSLAKKIGYDFMDLDTMVEEKEGTTLMDVMNTKGADYFRNMESDFLKLIDKNRKVVISPAGSIIFQADALKWIQENTIVIFLDTPFETIEKRLSETPKAVAGLQERGLKSIWDERIPLYIKYSVHRIDTRNKSVEQIVEEITNTCL